MAALAAALVGLALSAPAAGAAGAARSLRLGRGSGNPLEAPIRCVPLPITYAISGATWQGASNGAEAVSASGVTAGALGCPGHTSYVPIFLLVDAVAAMGGNSWLYDGGKGLAVSAVVGQSATITHISASGVTVHLGDGSTWTLSGARCGWCAAQRGRPLELIGLPGMAARIDLVGPQSGQLTIFAQARRG